MPLPSTSALKMKPPAHGPKGLWKARAIHSQSASRQTNRRPIGIARASSSDTDHDFDSDDFESISTSSTSSGARSRTKRRRRDSFGSAVSSGDDLDNDPDLDEERNLHWCHRLPQRQRGWTRRQRIMDTTSTAFVGAQTEMKASEAEVSKEDWLDLKDLFATAVEQYELFGGAGDALPLLRGVVHECHAFLKFYEDPSVLFTTTSPAPAPYTHPLHSWSTPPEEYAKPAWCRPDKRKCTCIDLPTAFHTLLGTALFLFGNLIDQDPSLALPGEPDSPLPYWLSALDVFETGENLPSRVYATGCDAPEDWRMSIVWGRTLVAIADAAINLAPGVPTCKASFCADEPNWPSESPFAAIVMRRPAFTRRMLLSKATPNDLIVLAIDQFSSGIFHMPHPHPQSGRVTKAANGGFSRPKELYTVASEVMLVAEKLPHASERQLWATWADSVLNQMKMEADMEGWRGIISRARGKCWLTAGTAFAPELEDQLSQGVEGVLQSEDAEDAREDLGKAIAFLEKGQSEDAVEEEDRRKMLAEAYMTLGNLTVDEVLQEALYRRGEEAGGLDLDGMDVDE